MIKRIANHLMIVLAVALIILLILDEYNPVMGFLTSGLSKIYLAVFGVCALVVGYANIVDFYHRTHGRRRRVRAEKETNEETAQG